jgi:hypothetical protein
MHIMRHLAAGRTFSFIVVLWLLSAQAMAADFFVKDTSLTSLPVFPDGVVRSHWTFKGYEACRVVGKPFNLVEEGEPATEGYFATTADECEWMTDSGPIWVVQRVHGALHMVLAHRGYATKVAPVSRNGLRHIYVLAVLAGALFEGLWEFNEEKYVNTREEKEVGP